MSERFKEHAWKACVWGNLHRGFESLSLRHKSKKESGLTFAARLKGLADIRDLDRELFAALVAALVILNSQAFCSESNVRTYAASSTSFAPVMIATASDIV